MCRCDSCHRAPVVMHHIVYPNQEHPDIRYVMASVSCPVHESFLGKASIQCLHDRPARRDPSVSPHAIHNYAKMVFLSWLQQPTKTLQRPIQKKLDKNVRNIPTSHAAMQPCSQLVQWFLLITPKWKNRIVTWDRFAPAQLRGSSSIRRKQGGVVAHYDRQPLFDSGPFPVGHRGSDSVTQLRIVTSHT